MYNFFDGSLNSRVKIVNEILITKFEWLRVSTRELKIEWEFYLTQSSRNKLDTEVLLSIEKERKKIFSHWVTRNAVVVTKIQKKSFKEKFSQFMLWIRFFKEKTGSACYAPFRKPMKENKNFCLGFGNRKFFFEMFLRSPRYKFNNTNKHYTNSFYSPDFL